MRIAILLALTTTLAHAGENEVSVGMFDRALRTSSANAITSDSLAGGTLGYARSLGIATLPGLALRVEGNFDWGAVDGVMFQVLGTELHTLGFTVGARAVYELVPHVVASARLDLGAARAALAIRDDAGHSARADGWGAVTEAALALDLYALYRPRLTLGFRFELGYVAATTIGMTPNPESASADTLQLQMMAASLGGLNLSGPVFSGSFVSQF